MGYYILAPDAALRSWAGTPHTCIRRFTAMPSGLGAEAFETALRCDGTQDVPESKALARLLSEGIVRPCRAGEAALTPWQRLRTYPNRVTPWISLEITGRCNYNCLHCFNAADNTQLQSELSVDRLRGLLDEASAAGVQAVLITGGEPLVHRGFREIVRAVYERDMFVHEINTNGSLLDRDTMAFLKSFGKLPEMKISFDGPGFHDWIRGKKGAEEEALRAIRLCVEEKAPIRIQMNINRRNREAIRPGITLLSEIGVPRIRVIPTVPTPRWAANAPDGSFTWEEYYRTALEESAWYAGSGLRPELTFWHAVTLRPGGRAYRLERVRYNTYTYRDQCPLCPTVHAMPAIGANGRIYPCMQMSGQMDAWGHVLGNVLESGLSPLLLEGRYCEQAHTRVSARLARGEKCADCRWHTWCAGGCPALGYLESSGDFLAHDPSACLFFEGGWTEKFEAALPGWINLTPLK